MGKIEQAEKEPEFSWETILPPQNKHTQESPSDTTCDLKRPQNKNERSCYFYWNDKTSNHAMNAGFLDESGLIFTLLTDFLNKDNNLMNSLALRLGVLRKRSLSGTGASQLMNKPKRIKPAEISRCFPCTGLPSLLLQPHPTLHVWACSKSKLLHKIIPATTKSVCWCAGICWMEGQENGTETRQWQK
jgi:hypothetical protein